MNNEIFETSFGTVELSLVDTKLLDVSVGLDTGSPTKPNVRPSGVYSLFPCWGLR